MSRSLISIIIIRMFRQKVSIHLQGSVNYLIKVHFQKIFPFKEFGHRLPAFFLYETSAGFFFLEQRAHFV